MKNLVKKSLVVLGLFTSLMGYANAGPEMIKEKESKVTNLSFKSVKQGSKLSIKDANGLILYKESIGKTGKYSKGFDLTALPNGDYYFELESELKIVLIPFNVAQNEVNFKKEEKNTIFKPVIRVKDEIVYLSRPSFDETPIDVKIFFSKNHDLILSEKFEKESELKRVYDFSKSQKGNYTFVFESNGRKYSKSIKI